MDKALAQYTRPVAAGRQARPAHVSGKQERGRERLAGRLGKVRLSSSGVHWFDRESGLNILLDEIQVPREWWHRAPRYVSIALTNACELRCPFCYAPKTPARLESHLVLTWLDELDRAGCLGVGFGGGEPTAHPDFAWLCQRAAERTNLAITFTTHGHRMNDKLVDALRGSIHFVRVSMDGMGSVYERLRGRPFDRFCQQLDQIARIAPFGLNFVVNAATVALLDDAVAFARQMGAFELLLLPEQSVGDRPGIDPGSKSQLKKWISTAPRPVRLAISEAGACEDMPLVHPHGDEAPLDAHAHIDARGVLRPNAYSSAGVRVRESVAVALEDLRSREVAA